jgi:hypothetical protein
VKTIPLTQGKEALVDDCDYEYLVQWKWQFQREGHRRTGYAVRIQRTGEKRSHLCMHRLVATRSGLVIDGKQLDHVDGDGLNNCRGDLRVSTTSQNHANRRRNRNNTSGFKGVTWNKRWKKWVAQIEVAGQNLYLNGFDDPRDAARAYNEAALEHFGEFACLNPV